MLRGAGGGASGMFGYGLYCVVGIQSSVRLERSGLDFFGSSLRQEYIENEGTSCQ